MSATVAVLGWRGAFACASGAGERSSATGGGADGRRGERRGMARRKRRRTGEVCWKGEAEGRRGGPRRRSRSRRARTATKSTRAKSSAHLRRCTSVLALHAPRPAPAAPRPCPHRARLPRWENLAADCRAREGRAAAPCAAEGGGKAELGGRGGGRARTVGEEGLRGREDGRRSEGEQEERPPCAETRTHPAVALALSPPLSLCAHCSSLSSRLLDGSPAGSESRSRWGRRGHPRPAVLPRRRPPRRLARPPLLSCRQCSVLHGYKAAASSSGPALLLRVKAPPLALVRPHPSARPGAARLARALRVHARSLPAALLLAG